MRQINLVEIRQCLNSLATEVHKGIRFEQPDLMATGIDPRHVAVEFFFLAKWHRMGCGNRIHKPETGVVARVFIFGAGITQSHDQINTC